MKTRPDYSSFLFDRETFEGLEFVRVHDGKKFDRYLLRRFRTGDGYVPGRAVAFFKLSGKQIVRYNVFLGVLPLGDTCDCNGYLIYGVCRHLIACRELGV